ncbi:hypothetical protein [Yoonia sediminilitoris]|uniref:Putative secreted protein n=1 Tax=Yoonia sediminilitoris TaxID=1286148 RepID=A0A2T6K8J7_9RHOB|nr:hypothetical protein [Yoonia sediminilitoris]PUB11071.1 putative secreted protein [Yoonia sediminilitoris]RCW90990.1 putative secreted protein [Yoonia sediminilitoris]
MNIYRTFSAAAFAVMCFAGSAHAITLSFAEFSSSSNDPATGASGEVQLDFSAVDGIARVDVTVTNTTELTDFGSGATESQLTGFGFDLLDGVAFAGMYVIGSFLDTTLLNASFSPFGTLDLAFSDNGDFNGGNANSALPEGQSDMFSFALTLGSFGTVAALEAAFEAAFIEESLDAGMRFQQVNAGEGSDKLLFNPEVSTVPLPAGLPLLLTCLAVTGILARRKGPSPASAIAQPV